MTVAPRQVADTAYDHTRILVRVTALDERTLQFADGLSAASGFAVTFVIDERRGPRPHHGRSVVGISDERCRALGLYCPSDYAWRCGDYGYYLARHAFPDVRYFWMIEYDVRFAGGDVRDFFACFGKHPEVDFLATGLGPAGWDWYWAITARARNVRPMRCLFPVTRLSAPAVEALLARRVAQERRPLRRFLWPNDEAMVATTLCHARFACRDLNDFGTTWYDDVSFSFTEPLDGDSFRAGSDGLRIFHPVLYGEQYHRKVARLQEAGAPRSRGRELAIRVAAKINSLMPW